jgi:hypothetical protein
MQEANVLMLYQYKGDTTTVPGWQSIKSTSVAIVLWHNLIVAHRSDYAYGFFSTDTS